MSPTDGTATRRRGSRRLHIVSAAADLFAADGYPAAGMDQIGAAAGITGPAIYRHFDSKAAILAAVFDGIIDAVTAPPSPPAAPADETDPAASPAAVVDPAAQLLTLVRVYAGAVASRRQLMGVFVREVHHLPPEHRVPARRAPAGLGPAMAFTAVRGTPVMERRRWCEPRSTGASGC